jgi:hypothetical protein
MIQDIETAWLYAYSPNEQTGQKTYYTLLLPVDQNAGATVQAQIALSYLTCLSGSGAGTVIHSYGVPFGPDVPLPKDYDQNACVAEGCVSITFELVANGAEAYAIGSAFILD